MRSCATCTLARGSLPSPRGSSALALARCATARTHETRALAWPRLEQLACRCACEASRRLAVLRGKKAVSAAVLEARHDALCYEMWLQQSQTSSRHGWPCATASTRAPRKAVPHCAAHANDAVGRVGQARAHCARSVEDDGEGGGGGGETRAASGRRRGRGSISGRLRGLAAPPRLSAPVRLIPEMVRRRAARHCRLCRAARTRAVRL